MQVLCSDLGNCNTLNKLNRYKKLYRTFLAFCAEIHKFISDCKHDLVDRAIEITAEMLVLFLLLCLSTVNSIIFSLLQKVTDKNGQITSAVYYFLFFL